MPNIVSGNLKSFFGWYGLLESIFLFELIEFSWFHLNVRHLLYLFVLFYCFVLFYLFICFILNLYWFDKFIYSNLFSSNFLKEINKNKQLLLIATPGLVKEHKHWKSVHNDKLTFIWKFQIDPNFSLLLEEKISYRKILFSVKTFNINNIYKKRRIQIKFLEFKRRYSSGPRDLHTWWFSVISMI